MLLLVISVPALRAQAYLSWGLIEGKQYDSTQFDSVDPQSHRLVIHIPIYSLKQKGSLPTLSINLVENSPTWEDMDTGHGYGVMQISAPENGSPGVYPAINALPVTQIEAFPYTEPVSQNTYYYGVNYLQDYTGAYHELHPLVSGSNYVAIDGSGYALNFNQGAIDPQGNIIGTNQITDVNGNYITVNSGYFIDSLSRTVPIPNWNKTMVSGSPTSGAGCVPLAYPSFQGSSTYTFCYESVTAQSSLTGLDPNQIVQGPISFLTLQSVTTPGGTYSFDYDSWGSVTRIGLPTGGSISYEYDTRSNSGYVNDAASVSRVVTKRTASTGNSASIGQTTITTYSFDDTVDAQSGFRTSSYAKTVYPDGSYSTNQSNGTVTIPGIGYYTADGEFLRNVDAATDNWSIVTWADGRIDKSCTVFYGTTVSYKDSCSGQQIPAASPAPPQWYNENEYVGTTPGPFHNQPLSLHIPTHVFEFSTGRNSLTGALAKHTTTRYAFEDNNAYVDANLFDQVGSVTVSDGSGNIASTTTTTYDESAYGVTGTKGLPTTVSSGGISTHTSYTSGGMASGTIDGRSNTSSTVVDFQCNSTYPKTVKNAASQQVVYTVDCNSGLTSSVLDANSQTTTYIYDSLNNLTSVSYPDGGGKTVDYNSYSQPITVTTTVTATPDPSIIEVDTYDGLGRITSQSRSAGSNPAINVDTKYDDSGRVLSVSNPYQQTSSGGDTYTYDALGRTIRIQHADGTADSTCYDGIAAAGSLNCSPSTASRDIAVSTWSDVTDASGRHSQRIFDSFGRLRQVTEPDAQRGDLTLRTKYSYDTLGNLTEVDQYGSQQSVQRQRLFHYDSLSRLVSAMNPETGWTCYGTTTGSGPATASNCTADYDGNGNLLHKTDARGAVTALTYDKLNRLVARDFSGTAAGLSSCYIYDAETTVNPAYAVGRLTGEWTQSGTCPNPQASSVPLQSASTARRVTSFDAMGRPLTEQRCIRGRCGAPRSLTYTYDTVGAVNSYTDGHGLSVTQSFDALGQLSSVTANNSNLYTLKSFGPTGWTRATLGNAMTLNQIYDNRQRISSFLATQGVQ